MNIDAAADDAAGVAIASRLTSEIRGTNQAIRNAADGQALINTAEGALDEVVNLLQRMRELAVQSANDTNDQPDRDALDLEYQDLIVEIDRIGNVTTWAGQGLLDAATTKTNDFKFMVGVGRAATAADDEVTAEIKGMVDLVKSASDLKSQTSAVAVIATVDTDIAAVDLERAKLGAYSNRLDSTVKNLTNIVTNLEAGRGRIEDADFAAETTNLAKVQILQQASMAMLAQANASKQGVLSLLQR
jgi:flagellin